MEEQTGVIIEQGPADWQIVQQDGCGNWQAVPTEENGTWKGALEHIPAGGLYRLETRLRTADNPAGEWSPRGDMRHFLGVGGWS